MSLDEPLPQFVIISLRPLGQMQASRLDNDLAPQCSQSFSRRQKVVAVLLPDILGKCIRRRTIPQLLNVSVARSDGATEVNDVRAREDAIPCLDYCCVASISSNKMTQSDCTSSI